MRYPFTGRAACLGIFLLLSGYSSAQEATDSSRTLPEATITSYPGRQPYLHIPASISVIDHRQLEAQPPFSLLPAMNTVPGVRMEERSPGSYRLSIRGSLLRSPFGIRNIKMYLGEFPLTDAGGNTYLNMIDMSALHEIEVIRGPDGSLFGANSGGVVMLNPYRRKNDSTNLGAGFSGGSYGLLREQVAFRKRAGRYELGFNQAYQRTDGYRQNASMKRHYLQTTHQFDYTKENQLKLLAFYSDLSYRTPGGLTRLQLEQDPRQARPPTATLPGADQQQAGIGTRSLFAGLYHRANIGNKIKHHFAMYGSGVLLENPFITNYEKRDEKTYGLRTYFEWQEILPGQISMKVNPGIEWQETKATIHNYGNRSGTADTLQTANQVNSRQYFYFLRGVFVFRYKLTAELAASVNHYHYDYSSLPGSSPLSSKTLAPQLMPRFALSYAIKNSLVVRTSISRGYSPPSIAEVRASNQVINTMLSAESGWNFESGIRFQDQNGRLSLDASAFYYRLENAITRRTDPGGNEYFVNSGGTDQRGIEAQGTFMIITRPKGFLQHLNWMESATLYRFVFSNYSNAAMVYSGNRVTGVPPHVLVSGLTAGLAHGFYVFAQHNYTGRIPLNDAGTVSEKPYQLLQAKLGWKKNTARFLLEIFAGADNLFDERYSLGNDLNAAGGRYFNAAPARNYFAGINISL